MLIVFEGIDRSGVTSLSINFTQYLNRLYKDKDGLLRVDPHFGDFVWTKEPMFSRDQAVLFNSPRYMEEYQRERIFFESRITHQKFLAGKNMVCDRYLWSGIAYAHKYSPGCFRLLKELYLSEKLFVQPDLYILVDTPPQVCFERDVTLDLDALKELRESYMVTREYIRTPIIVTQGVNGEDNAMQELIPLFEDYMSKSDTK